MLNLFTMQWPHAHNTFHVTRTTRYGKEWLKTIIQTTHPSVWLLPSQTHVTYDKLYNMPSITWVDTAMFEAVYEGERNNRFSKIQLVGQKYQNKKLFAS